MFLDLVWKRRFLSLRWGPITLTSTKGRNMPDVCHFKSLAPMTERGEEGETAGRGRPDGDSRTGTAGRGRPDAGVPGPGLTFDGDLPLAAARLSVQLYLGRDLADRLVHT